MLSGIGMSSELDLEKMLDRGFAATNTERRQSEQSLAMEIDAAERLQQVATRLITARGTESLFEEILDAAVAIMKSDFASIQMLFPERGAKGELGLIGHRGFNAEAAKRWEWVDPAMHTTCAEASRSGRRVVVSDVRNCAFLSGSADLDEYLSAGIHAVQSTPLISRSGVLLGMVSTHWRNPHELKVSEQRGIDILARLAADLIERSRAEEILSESEARTTRELTERKRVEGALRESEERFRRVFEEGPLGVALQGPDHRFLKVNHALCQMMGYSAAELVQMSFVDITHPEDVQSDLKLADRLLRREMPSYRIQKRYVTKDGQILWVNLTKSLIVDNDGAPLYGITMVEDITEVKRTQQEAIARQKLESLGTLASGIAHDFNNLLGAIHAQAELAQSELDGGSPCREELQSIRDVATRGSEIVRQLMIYAGKETEVDELVSLTGIVKEMLPLLKVSLSKHAILTTELSPDLPVTRASAGQLRQVVMNLVINASDAIGDRDGAIRVIARRMNPRGGEVAVPETAPEGDYIALEVSDTGCGMSPEIQVRVFDPFFSTKSTGRGLGLAVVSGIVRSLGGEIHVTSEYGKGTTFQILLPCAENEAKPSNASMSDCGESINRSEESTVLVVEDEPVLRSAIVRKLRKTGLVVLEASNGSDAISLLRSNADQIDVMLLDMTIPGASSTEVILEVAQTRPDISILLTSAYSQQTLPVSSNASQICGFLRKPFQLEDLVKSIRRVSSAA
jgi:PAS domain S-box-containing protein